MHDTPNDFLHVPVESHSRFAPQRPGPLVMHTAATLNVDGLAVPVMHVDRSRHWSLPHVTSLTPGVPPPGVSQYDTSEPLVQPPPFLQRPAAFALYTWHELPDQPLMVLVHVMAAEHAPPVAAQPAGLEQVGEQVVPLAHEKQPGAQSTAQQCGPTPPQNGDTHSVDDDDCTEHVCPFTLRQLPPVVHTRPVPHDCVLSVLHTSATES